MPSAKPVFINGRFLQQQLSGVQRFAREMVIGIDGLIKSDPWADGRRWTVLVPRGAEVDLQLANMALEEVGVAGGHLWEQTFLPLVTRQGLLINLANAGPLLHPNQIVVMHDTLVFRHPENYSFLYRNLHRFLGRRLARTSTLATVSEFSKAELQAVLGKTDRDIGVAPNGADHHRRTLPDASAILRLGLVPGGYFLCVGSLSRTKNIQMAVEAFIRADLGPIRLALVGDLNDAVFGAGQAIDAAGVVFAGRVSDRELAGLYSGAIALIFPSLYEGFGIPPLEAMTHDCPVLASDIPPVREVCSDAVEYFDPKDVQQLSVLLRRRVEAPDLQTAWRQKGQARARGFRWEASAARLLRMIQGMEEVRGAKTPGAQPEPSRP